MARPHRLVTNTRGASLVAGIFMAAILCGALFFLAGVGRALVQREALQDSADAVAFTSAVYHARGMNLIVLLNVLPAALILVLIGVKVVHGIGFVMRVAECTYGGPACDSARAMEDAAIRIETDVFPRVHAMLENLYASQNALAVGMPWVATARASRMVTSSGFASFGVAIGPSLVGRRTTFLDPYEAERVLETAPPAIRDVGTWPGLPLADQTAANPNEDWAVSCRQNVDLLESLTRQVVTRYGVPITPSTEYVWAQLRSGGLCGEGFNNTLFTAVDIDGERRLAQTLYRAPKKVVPGVKLGTDAFAIWSVVGGHSDVTRGADRGVEIAGPARRIPPPPRIADVQVAKAEYYFEPARPGATWKEIEPIAMWTMRWRARLRRVRPPEPEVRDAMRRAMAMDVASFAEGRRGPIVGDGAGAAVARAEGTRLLEQWFAAGSIGSTPETMNAWLAAQDGVVRPNDIRIIH